MLADTNWELIVGIGTVILVVLTAGLLWVALIDPRSRRREQEEERKIADARAERLAAGAADGALHAKEWHFRHTLRPVVGDVEPQGSPVEVRIVGASVWVHEVRLTWRPLEPALAYWTTKDELCPPRGKQKMPFLLHPTGPALEFGWPDPNPDRQEGLYTKLDVIYSATPDGRRHRRQAMEGSVAWQ